MIKLSLMASFFLVALSTMALAHTFTIMETQQVRIHLQRHGILEAVAVRPEVSLPLRSSKNLYNHLNQ